MYKDNMVQFHLFNNLQNNTTDYYGYMQIHIDKNIKTCMQSETLNSR